MKKWFILFILFFIFSCISFDINDNALDKHTQSEYFMEITEDNSLQKIIDVNAEKHIVFDRINEYFKVIFTDDESKIKLQDKEKGLIEGIGNIVLVIDSYTYRHASGSIQ